MYYEESVASVALERNQLRQHLDFEKREHIEMQKYTLELEKQLASVTKQRDELASSLTKLMKYTPRINRIGGIDRGYDVPAGAALCAVLDRCEAAIAKLGANKTEE